MYNLDTIKKTALIFDIETYAEYPDGREINIQTNFEDYVKYARCKWFGAYSYKYNKLFLLNVQEHYHAIVDILSDHNVLVGFNNEEFDYPIVVNNGLSDIDKKFNQIDCMKILGASSFKDKNGFKYKNRGNLMGYSFKNNSLGCMASTMGLESQKSKIDYRIFAKNTWTVEETKLIKDYLKDDVLATKGLFDKLWDYWIPFTSLIDYKHVINLSWIKSSIASLTYKAACFVLDTEPTYSDSPKSTEEMGGNVFEPKYEEAYDVWHLDFTSLYPHIFCMFNLFAEVEESYPVKKWHGNDIFKVKGHYDIFNKHKLTTYVEEKLKQRIKLKNEDPDNPMVYTLKILLNGLYGIVRSAIFEKVHQPNAGWDVCWLGQQIQDYTKRRLEDMGFESIAGDTDALDVQIKDKSKSTYDHVNNCLKLIIDEIKQNVPFPLDSFEIKIEKNFKYVLYPFSEHPIVDEVTGKNKKLKNRLVTQLKGKKKNYLYIYENKGVKEIVIVGLPLIKDNATPLGLKIFEEVLEPLILDKGHAKFDKAFIAEKIDGYLKNQEIMSLLAVEYKVKPFASYKNPSQIQAQISKGYFNGQEGVISLIKNNKVGKAGKGTLYCSIEEAIENKLVVDDLDIEKTWNELEPFCLREALDKVPTDVV